MGIMDKLGFGGSSSGNSTPGSGNTSLQESLEQFLKSQKVEDAKVKMNEAMTKAKETASSVAKKAEEYATKAAESISEQMNTGTTASPQSQQQSSQQQPMPQSAPQPAPEMMPLPEQQQTDEPEQTDEQRHEQGTKYIENRNFAKGYQLIQQAADHGFTMSMNSMGLGFLKGYGCEQNYYMGYFYLAMAATRGNKYGLWNIGNMNLYGWGISQNKSNALKWFQRASDAGHDYNTKSVITVLQKELHPNAAEPTEDDMMAYVAKLWNDSQFDMALEYAQKAVNRGYHKLQHFIGMSWDKGKGNPMDPAKAISCYKAASDRGIGESAYFLGQIYEFGKGTQKDYPLALQYYQRAEQLGYKDANTAVQVLLRKINVTDQVTVQQGRSGEEYYQQALQACNAKDYSAYSLLALYSARTGNPGGTYSRAWCCRYGLGMVPNAQEALQLLQKSEEQGAIDASMQLGLMYEYGTGVEKDEEKAYEYYCKTLELNLSDSCEYLERIFRKRSDLRKAYIERHPLQEAYAYKENEMRNICALTGEQDWYIIANAVGTGFGLEEAKDKFIKACLLTGIKEKDYEKARNNLETYKEYADVDVTHYLEELGCLAENEKNRASLEQKDLEELKTLAQEADEKKFDYLFQWYAEIMADKGDPLMMTYLGEICLQCANDCDYGTAYGVVTDLSGNNYVSIYYEYAYEWFVKADEAGDEVACYYLGMMYREGSYVQRDLVLAKRYMQKAVINEVEDAKEALESIKQEMEECGIEDTQTKNVESVEDLPENLDSYFEGIIGLGTVRKQLETLYQSVKIKLLRARVLKDRGEAPAETGEGYNFVLLGNPGTGKTMVARIIAKILYDIGIRTSDVFVEVDRSKLVSDHYGGTEKKVREYLNDTGNGTLFIDEAHTLFREDSDKDFGQEAIDTLLKEMEDHRGEFSVIMAGYKAPMMNMMKNANSGFASRFTYIIELPDYTEAELLQIAHTLIEQKKYVAEEGVDGAIIKCINRDKIDDTFGNARYIRELVEKAIRNMAVRLNTVDKIEENMLFLLKPEDFWDGEPDETAQTYLAELYGLVGLPAVKKEVQTLTNRIMVQTEMEKRGLKSRNDFGTLHMAFKGNPGTGKTTVARIIGKLYASLGILKRKDVFVECSRATLVGQYQGSTAINVKKAVDSAMGGILFIDEAYSLVKGEGDTFGKEAVDTLVSEMENNRNNLIVIFAGYSRDLDEFFKNNQGLKSRVPIELVFEDYTEEELFEISCKMIAANNYTLNEMSKQKLREFLKKESAKADFGNARGARNVVEACIRNQNDRIAAALCDPESVVTDEMLTVIEEFDIS